MGDTWIVNMTHFVSESGSVADMPPPVMRKAMFFGSIVSAATVSLPGELVETALRCRRRPGRKPCPGHLVVRLQEVPPEIGWSCSQCDDNGRIRNWRGTMWDLSRPGAAADEKRYEVPLTDDEYKALRDAVAFDQDALRIVFGAVAIGRGIVISGGFDDLDYFLDSLAAEANNEPNRKKRKLLDAVYDRARKKLPGNR